MQKRIRKRVALLLTAGVICSFVIPGDVVLVKAEEQDAVMAEQSDGMGQTPEKVETLDSANKDSQGILYTLNEETKTAMVGEVRDAVDENTSEYEGAGDGNVLLPETVTKDGVSYSVTEVAYGAFWENQTLKSVTLSDTIVTLGEKSFYGSSVQSLTVGEGLETISAYALGRMEHLETIEVSAANKYYSEKDGILYNKNQTTLIKYPVANAREDYAIPAHVYIIAESAFSMSSIKKVTFPKTVRVIGDEAFYGSAIETADLKHVANMGERAFSQCTSLRWVRLRDYVQLGKEAFDGDSSMKVVYLPKGTFKLNAFSNVNNAELLVIEDDVVVKSERYCFERCEKLKTVIIGDVLWLTPYCLYKNTSLEKIYLPSSLNISGQILGGSKTEVYSSSLKLKSYCATKGISFHDTSEHTHTLKDHIFYLDDEIIIKGKYCEECGHGEDTSFLLQSEVENGEPEEEEVLTYSLDEENRDAQEIVYSLDPGARTASVGVAANGCQYEGLNNGNVMIPERVEKNGVIYTVTELNPHCFYGNQMLRSLTLPDSIKILGERAVSSCKNLSEIHVSNKNPYWMSEDGVMFSRDGTILCLYPSLKEDKCYQIPYGVYTIEATAFSHTELLYEITFSATVTEIKDNAFDAASNIKWLDLRHVKVIGRNAFLYNKNVKMLLLSPGTIVGSQAFGHCESLQTAHIPENVKLGAYSFGHCTELKTVIMRKGSRLGGEGIFTWCEKLETLVLPEDIDVIPESTVSAAYDFDRLYLPDTVQEIGKGFNNCGTLVYGSPAVDTENIEEFVDITSHEHQLQQTVFIENEFEKVTGDFCEECGYAENITRQILLEDAEEETPTPAPETSESPVPTVEPTPLPTETPPPEESLSPVPTEMPTVPPMETPTVSEAPVVSPSPTETPPAEVSASPTASPIESPVPSMEESPSPVSTVEPTALPAEMPGVSDLPTQAPKESKPSNILPDSVPTVKTLNVSLSKNGKVARLKWSREGSPICFSIYRSKKRSGKYIRIGEVKGTAGTYSDKTVKPFTTYYYRIGVEMQKDGKRVVTRYSDTCSLKVPGYAPVVSVKKGKQGSIRFITVRMKKYMGKYADIYISFGRKKFKKLKLFSNKISKYKGRFKIQYVVKHKVIRFKVRTYLKKGGKKTYSRFSKVVKVKV